MRTQAYPTRFTPRRLPALALGISLSLGVSWTCPAAVLVDLDAIALPEGPLPTWPNKGSVAGDFTSAGSAVPEVVSVDGAKGVAFLGGTGATAGTHYVGPAAPEQVTENGSRTVEAWVYNPSAQDEETVFSWGRRGGPDGTNCSFNHGQNGAYGALGHWGSPDIGWDGHIAFNQWTYIAYTYDGGAQTTAVYKDGAVANTEVLGAPLATWSTDNTAAENPLPFRVARQNTAAGAPSDVGVGEITIARIRVHDTALEAAAIESKFKAEKRDFLIGDADNDGLPDWRTPYASRASRAASCHRAKRLECACLSTALPGRCCSRAQAKAPVNRTRSIPYPILLSLCRGDRL